MMNSFHAEEQFALIKLSNGQKISKTFLVKMCSKKLESVMESMTVLASALDRVELATKQLSTIFTNTKYNVLDKLN